MIFFKRSSIGLAIAVMVLGVMTRASDAVIKKASASSKADSVECSKKVNGKCEDKAAKKNIVKESGRMKAGSGAAFSAVPDVGRGQAVCPRNRPNCASPAAAQKAPFPNPLLSPALLPIQPKNFLSKPANATAAQGARSSLADLFKKPVPAPSKEPKEPPDDPAFDSLNCKFWIFGCQKKSTLAYEQRPGELFVQGSGDSDAVSPTDVKQGGIGDCYYLASLAAVAKNDPDAIRDMIHDNGNGTYSVTFHQKRNFWEFWKPEYTDVTVTVDDDFPVENGGLAFSKKGDGSELWTMVAEKAYAQYRGSYNSISTGGLGGPELQLLTGTDTQYHAAMFTSFDRLAEWNDKGYAITAGSLPNAILGDSGNVVGQHMYYIKAIDKENRTITLGNPWGYNDAVLTEAQFKRNYGLVSVNTLD